MSTPRRYEVDTLRGRSITIFIVGFIACGAVSFWIVKKTLRRLDLSVPQVPATSLVHAAPARSSAPSLQPTEAVDRSAADDLEALRSHEDSVFEKLGWQVDRSRHQAVISDQLIQHLIKSHQSEVGK